MKKLIAIMVTLVMLCAVVPVLGSGLPTDEPNSGDNQAYQSTNGQYQQTDVTTTATIGGGTGGEGGQGVDPIIKVKWEYDMDETYHDSDFCTEHLQVAPIIGETVTVGYYAVVTSPNGINPDSDELGYVYTYADIWHPDGQFKYQIELYPVGWNGNTNTYNKADALGLWDIATEYHMDLIKVNDLWEQSLPVGIDPYDDVYDELNEELALLYYGAAELSYCQPGGYYYVGATAFDKLGNQADYLYNNFWYIPTSAVQIDFYTVDYSPIHIGTHKVVGGDQDMTTSSKPTVRNIGNTPVILGVNQSDMGFGMTGSNWNVKFDARMTANGAYVYYWPYQLAIIPGVLPLCTTEKLDFSIKATKGVSGVTYSGWMKIYAYIDCTSYVWGTPSQFVSNAPYPIPQSYPGPSDPWAPLP